MLKTKILIIDDEEDFCKLVKITLESGGDFEVKIGLIEKGANYQ